MSPEVVVERQKRLELYLRKLVTEYPKSLGSPQMDEFLCITDRVKSMRG